MAGGRQRSGGLKPLIMRWLGDLTTHLRCPAPPVARSEDDASSHSDRLALRFLRQTPRLAMHLAQRKPGFEARAASPAPAPRAGARATPAHRPARYLCPTNRPSAIGREQDLSGSSISCSSGRSSCAAADWAVNGLGELVLRKDGEEYRRQGCFLVSRQADAQLQKPRVSSLHHLFVSVV